LISSATEQEAMRRCKGRTKEGNRKRVRTYGCPKGVEQIQGLGAGRKSGQDLEGRTRGEVNLGGRGKDSLIARRRITTVKRGRIRKESLGGVF